MYNKHEYNKHMNIRKTFAGLCASLLAVTLISFGFSWSAWHVLGQPDYIKQTLHDSGIYQTVVQDLLKQKQADIADMAGASGGQPEVQNAIAKALPPELLQTQTEKVIDGSFDWLQGKTDTLHATFDIGSAKQQIADGIASATDKHLRSLSTCTTAASLQSSASTNALEATCLPPGFDIPAAVNQARQNVLGSEALQNTSLNANEIQTGNGTSLQQQLQSGPQIYERVQWAIYGQGILAILLAVGLVLLSTDWRIGIRRLGIIALWTGALSAGVAWLSGIAVKYAADKLAANTAGVQALQQKAIGIVQVVVDDIRMWWLYYGAALAIFGIVLLITYRFVRSTPVKVAAALAKEEGVSMTSTSNDPPVAAAPIASAPTAQSARPPIPKKLRRIQ
jgi:hypothetical protein